MNVTTRLAFWILISLAMGAGMIALAIVFTRPAAAQSLCALRETVLERLKSKYHEVIKHRGIASNGAMMEFTASAEGSWSLLMTLPNSSKVMCVVATGQGWSDVDVPLGSPT